MNYIESLINQGINFVANYDYGLLAAKVVVKSAKFVIENGIEVLQLLN